MRLVFLASAKRDLDEIAAYIERQSHSGKTAIAVTDKISAYCEKLAGLPAMMGRSRPELRPGFRSVAFGNYVVFLRYVGEPRHTLEVINVLHGARDIEAFFGNAPDD